MKGARFSGIASGIKPGGLDLGLVTFPYPAPVSALYTRNRVKAAHILYNMRHASDKVRALLVNSGVCQCLHRHAGIDDLATIATELARHLGMEREEILFASTGVIGKRLPVGTVVDALPGLVSGLREDGLETFARAMMTTDTYPKMVEEIVGDHAVRGVAKGAGMMNPLFATMLAFLFTDYPVEPARLRRLLPALGRYSFERISVDGDTSTNDTVLVFSGDTAALPGPLPPVPPLKAVLGRLMRDLALMVVRDGEGATKVIHITVRGARGRASAERIARRVAASPLVKTAFFGCDPNWGRIIAAAGDADVAIDPALVEIIVQDVVLARDGVEIPFSEEEMRRVLASREIELVVDLHDGRASHDMYTTDLTYDYVKINASYRT
jgi:glutamate N-acetyltransferase/amino-acid N-acetyltransferase